MSYAIHKPPPKWRAAIYASKIANLHAQIAEIYKMRLIDGDNTNDARRLARLHIDIALAFTELSMTYSPKTDDDE